VAHSSRVYDQKTELDVEMLSLFTPVEQRMYKDRFVEAGKKTGEVK